MTEIRLDGKDENIKPFRWMLRFGVTGDLRFISHHDTLRLLRRAMVRAGIPVRYSQGFNPHPRISIPLPKPVGVASHSEAVIFETTSDLDPIELKKSVDEATPANMPVYSCERVGLSDRFQPAMAHYILDASDRSADRLAECVERIMSAERIDIERVVRKRKTTRSLNVREFLADMSLDGNDIRFTLRITEKGTAKPAEIASLFDYDAGAVCHRITRTEVEWREFDPSTQ